MAGTNDFLPFGTAGGANVVSQSAYAAASYRTAGFSTGEAVSGQLNKVWRQASTMAAVMGKIISDANINALDNGDVTGIATNFLAALEKLLSPTPVPGIVAYYAHQFAPPGRWVACDGQLLDRVGTYADLFAVIGTDFNTGGEPGDKFRVPDLRGVFVRGQDAGRGLDPSRVLGSYQADQNAAHTHTFPVMEPDDNGGSFVASDQGGDQTATVTTSSSGGSEVRVKNIALRAFISY